MFSLQDRRYWSHAVHLHVHKVQHINSLPALVMGDAYMHISAKIFVDVSAGILSALPSIT